MVVASVEGADLLDTLDLQPASNLYRVPMTGYLISEVAQRTGFSTSALRFYEQSGLVRPGRTEAGYRRYDDDHLDTLAFIARAKGLGLSLEEITELLGLLGQDRCAPVQHRLKDLVADRIADADRRITELTLLATELRRVAASLEEHTPDGPCDDSCGCTSPTTGAVVTFVVRRGRPGTTRVVPA